MAKIRFMCEIPTGVPNEDNIYAMARMQQAQKLAERHKWEHAVEPSLIGSSVDFYIEVPDEYVNDVIGRLLDAGIAPGPIDFDHLTGVEAEKAATAILEHNEAFLPEE